MSNKAKIFLTFCCAICILLAVTSIFNGSKRDLVEIKYTVSKGDTLWGIACNHCPDSMDKQEYICMVRNANNLDSSIIYPGQVLTIYKIAE